MSIRSAKAVATPQALSSAGGSSETQARGDVPGATSASDAVTLHIAPDGYAATDCFTTAASRRVLCEASQYWAGMFRAGMREGRTGEITEHFGAAPDSWRRG